MIKHYTGRGAGPFSPVNTGYLALLLLFLPLSTEAQNTEVDTRYRRGIDVSPHIGLYHPYGYGGGLSLLVGRKGRHSLLKDPSGPGFRSFEGLSLDAGLYRGAIRFGLSYFDYSNSFIPGGAKAGLSYYRTNPYSWVAKESELLGLELEINLIVQFKAGLLYHLAGKKVIPSIGIGFCYTPGI